MIHLPVPAPDLKHDPSKDDPDVCWIHRPGSKVMDVVALEHSTGFVGRVVGPLAQVQPVELIIPSAHYGPFPSRLAFVWDKWDFYAQDFERWARYETWNTAVRGTGTGHTIASYGKIHADMTDEQRYGGVDGDNYGRFQCVWLPVITPCSLREDCMRGTTPEKANRRHKAGMDKLAEDFPDFHWTPERVYAERPVWKTD